MVKDFVVFDHFEHVTGKPVNTVFAAFAPKRFSTLSEAEAFARTAPGTPVIVPRRGL